MQKPLMELWYDSENLSRHYAHETIMMDTDQDRK